MGAGTSSPWHGFLDDAGRVPSTAAGGLVGAREVTDTDLPATDPGDLAGRPLRVVVSGGAGQLAGPAGLAARRHLPLAALVVLLRDHDDPGGNARRVVAAVDDASSRGLLADGVEVHVGVAGTPTGRWLDAADEVAAAELSLALPLQAGGDAVPAWIDAALDRETAFSLRGGDVVAAAEALRTTARLWEPGAPDTPGTLVAARRWCRSWSCPDVAVAAAYLGGPSGGAG